MSASDLDENVLILSDDVTDKLVKDSPDRRDHVMVTPFDNG